MGLIQWLQPKTVSDAGASNAAEAQTKKGVSAVGEMSDSETYPDFDHTVADAMCLLLYAAETGRKVDDAARSAVLRAKAATSAGADQTVTADLLTGLTKLAGDLSPVTADTLRASRDKQAKPTIKGLRKLTFILAVPIILFSLIGFVTSSISSAIRIDIITANELLVRLRSELGTVTAPTDGTPDNPTLPKGLNEGEVITQLQQYATTVRAIDARARQLNWFVFHGERDPFKEWRWDPKRTPEVNEENQKKLRDKFQLTVELPNPLKDLDRLTTTYQEVRSFAQNILDLVTVSYGAITTCLLPVLYALLGTCAYLLRCFEEELRTLTFTPSSRANWARFLVAGIGGAVVGLFSNFNITQGASISPLAIAFLVGYAVDVFFSFLEGLLQAFSKRTSAAQLNQQREHEPKAG